MERAKKPNGKRVVIAAAVALVVINYLNVKLGSSPFIYCTLQPLAQTLYVDWGMASLYLASAFLVYYLWRMNVPHAMGILGIMVGIIQLPTIADLVFRMGGTCHG